MISVTVTAIVMTIVKGQVENHLAFRKTFLDGQDPPPRPLAVPSFSPTLLPEIHSQHHGFSQPTKTEAKEERQKSEYNLLQIFVQWEKHEFDEERKPYLLAKILEYF